MKAIAALPVGFVVIGNYYFAPAALTELSGLASVGPSQDNGAVTRAISLNHDFAWVSLDAKTWTVAPAPFVLNYAAYAIGWDDGVILATSSADGSRAAFWRSTDGRTWKESPAGPNLAFDVPADNAQLGLDQRPDFGLVVDLHRDGNELVAEGVPICGQDCWDRLRDFIVWRSTDGNVWSRSIEPLDDQWDIRHGGGELRPVPAGDGWIRISPDHTSIEYSADRVAWADVLGASYTEVTVVRPYSGGYLALLGGPPGVLASADGQQWFVATPPVSSGLLDFAEGNHQIAATPAVIGPGNPYVWVGSAPTLAAFK